MNKSLCMVMTALILGMVSCPQVLAAQDDGSMSSRVRKADAADVNVDSSRVRSVQAGNSGAAYSSRVRKARTEEAPAAVEEARVKPVTGNLPERVSDPAESSSATGNTVAYSTPAVAQPADTGEPALLSAPPEKIKTVKYPNSKLPMSTNMPVGSVYYDYIDKLEGMGLIKSMLYGTRPYSRMDMARWTLEAKEGLKKDPAVADFVVNMVTRLEKALAPEIAQIEAFNAGEKPGTQFKVQSTKLELAGADLHSNDGYAYRNLKNARWQSFSENRNGHHYQHGFNANASVYMNGNLGRDMAVSATVRAAWDTKDHGTASLDEGYLSTRMGIWNFDIGKQAIDWGQGVTGKLMFSNNARPRTMLKISNELQPKSKGFLAFLGQTKFTAFASRLDGDARTEGGVQDHRHPWLFGFRADLVWKNFTLGLARGSMLGGEGHPFHWKNFGKWLIGDNMGKGDEWNDIAGIDFRWRMPGVHIYGELYGEDQAHGFPGKKAFTGGIYIPRLSYDGAWDMRLEAGHTNNVWYGHSVYHAGWTYHNDIMGNAMGVSADRFYGNINYYASASDKIGFHGSYWKMDQADKTDRKVKNAWLTYDKLLGKNDTLNFMVGLSDISSGGKYGISAKDKIVRVIWEHQY